MDEATSQAVLELLQEMDGLQTEWGLLGPAIHELDNHSEVEDGLRIGMRALTQAIRYIADPPKRFTWHLVSEEVQPMYEGRPLGESFSTYWIAT